MGFEGTLRADDRQFVESPDMGYLICVERTRGMTKAGEWRVASVEWSYTTPIAFKQPIDARFRPDR